MGLKSSLRINLADAAGVSQTQSVTSYTKVGVVLFPDPDQSYGLGSAVATLQFSADGENFVNSTNTLSNSTQGVFGIDISGVHSLRFATTTGDGSADPSGRISVYLQ